MLPVFSFRPEGCSTTTRPLRKRSLLSAAIKRSGANSSSEEHKKIQWKKRRTKQRKQPEENENSAPSAPSRTARAQTRAPPRTDPSSAPYRLCGPLRPCPGSAGPGDAGPLGGARPRPQQRPRPKRGGEPEAPCPQPRPRTATSQDRTRTRRSLTACDRPQLRPAAIPHFLRAPLRLGSAFCRPPQSGSTSSRPPPPGSTFSRPPPPRSASSGRCGSREGP